MISANDSSELTAIATDIVKAVYAQVETNSQSITRETLEELKVSFDAKIDTLNTSIASLKDEVFKLRQEYGVAQLVEQQIVRALARVSINSFQYYEDGASGVLESEDLVKVILSKFRKGRGYCISKCGLTRHNTIGKMGKLLDVVSNQNEFREKLLEQICDLLRSNPRIELEGGKFMIYYC